MTDTVDRLLADVAILILGSFFAGFVSGLLRELGQEGPGLWACGVLIFATTLLVGYRWGRRARRGG